MLTDISFSGLIYADAYQGLSSWFTADHSNGTNDTLWGYGFTYDAYGMPTGARTVTDYTVYGNWSADLLVDVPDIDVPASWVLNAAYTLSTADDIDLIRTALAGADDIYGSDHTDVLDGFDGDDLSWDTAGSDIVYGEGGDDFLFGGMGADEIDGGQGRYAAVVLHPDGGRQPFRWVNGVGSGGDAAGDILHNIEDLQPDRTSATI